MFTGIVEEIGMVDKIFLEKDSARIKISASKVLQGLKLGDSVSTNGVCLTVTKLDNKSFCADIMGETLRRSNFWELKKGNKVNLERALALGDRLGGHLVSGHIDGSGVIKNFTKDDNAIWITVEPNLNILKYIVFKGSIAIDGVSLTVAYIDEKFFKVCIVPHTQSETILINKKVGDSVNLECDMIGKYVEKFLCNKEEKNTNKKSIDINFLQQNGFI